MCKAPQIKSFELKHCPVPSDVAKGQTTHAYHDQADVHRQPAGCHVSRSYGAQGLTNSAVLIGNV